MKGFIRSYKWIDYTYLVFTDPKKLAELISREETSSIPAGFIVVAFVVAIEILAQSLLKIQTPFFFTKITYGWILGFLALSFKIVLLSCMIDFVCQFLGFAGSIKQLLAIMTFSLLPHALLLPALMIFHVFSFAPVFFYIGISMVLAIWSAYIIIVGISQIHSIEFFRSIMIFLAPFVATGILVFFVIVLLSMNITGYLSVI